MLDLIATANKIIGNYNTSSPAWIPRAICDYFHDHSSFENFPTKIDFQALCDIIAEYQRVDRPLAGDEEKYYGFILQGLPADDIDDETLA